MDRGRVRVYLKDTLLKDFTRKTLADATRPLRVLGLEEARGIAERYIKPHGIRFSDGRVVCWGRADDWKAILLAAYERAWIAQNSTSFGVGLMGASGRYAGPEARTMVEAAGQRLGIEHIVWLGV